MDVRNCRKCGRLYNYIGGSYKHLCPQCIEGLEELFQKVKEYIEENPGASMPIVSRDCDVSPQQIETWVREERLVLSDDSPIGISCEQCGKSIHSGRYCTECKNKMSNNLGRAYGQPIMATESRPLRDKSGERMRFLDNNS